MITQTVVVSVACDVDGCKCSFGVRGRPGEFSHTVLARARAHAEKQGWRLAQIWKCPAHSTGQ